VASAIRHRLFNAYQSRSPAGHDAGTIVAGGVSRDAIYW
jgi:hypothetical protein